MVENQVIEILHKLAPTSQRTMKTWRVTGTPESVVEERVGEQLLSLGIELGYCARLGEVDVRIVGSDAQINAAEAIIVEAFGKCVLPASFHSIEEYLVLELSKKGQTLSTAESCTGGYISNLITNVPGSSAVFTHGFVCYANQAKESLGVPKELIATHGAVSETVAGSLAINVRRTTGSSFALVTTEKPVGTVYIGLASPDDSCVVERHLFSTDRLSFKQLASQAALNLLRRALLVCAPPGQFRAGLLR
jgi:nicotinamide-nucleotide amidase